MRVLLAQREERQAVRARRLRFEASAASASAQSRVLRHPVEGRGASPHVRPSRRFRVSLSLAQSEERQAVRARRSRFESSVCSACVSSCRVASPQGGESGFKSPWGSNPHVRPAVSDSGNPSCAYVQEKGGSTPHTTLSNTKKRL